MSCLLADSLCGKPLGHPPCTPCLVGLHFEWELLPHENSRPNGRMPFEPLLEPHGADDMLLMGLALPQRCQDLRLHFRQWNIPVLWAAFPEPIGLERNHGDAGGGSSPWQLPVAPSPCHLCPSSPARQPSSAPLPSGCRHVSRISRWLTGSPEERNDFHAMCCEHLAHLTSVVESSVHRRLSWPTSPRHPTSHEGLGTWIRSWKSTAFLDDGSHVKTGRHINHRKHCVLLTCMIPDLQSIKADHLIEVIGKAWTSTHWVVARLLGCVFTFLAPDKPCSLLQFWWCLSCLEDILQNLGCWMPKLLVQPPDGDPCSLREFSPQLSPPCFTLRCSCNHKLVQHQTFLLSCCERNTIDFSRKLLTRLFIFFDFTSKTSPRVLVYVSCFWMSHQNFPKLNCQRIFKSLGHVTRLAPLTQVLLEGLCFISCRGSSTKSKVQVTTKSPGIVTQFWVVGCHNQDPTLIHVCFNHEVVELVLRQRLLEENNNQTRTDVWNLLHQQLHRFFPWVFGHQNTCFVIQRSGQLNIWKNNQMRGHIQRSGTNHGFQNTVIHLNYLQTIFVDLLVTLAHGLRHLFHCNHALMKTGSRWSSFYFKIARFFIGR